MKYVKVTATATGNRLDAGTYLELLPTLVEALPPGAWAFAADPDHYDFAGRQCVKDLPLDTVQPGE
ncbi:hypothetical protein [Kutzneria sp. NPDC051319]|uniref:hypothetical protein n=1 Tax=Kutzneria sp. NPDC051319 TaxID=3155047 RepID=UPI00341CA8DC